MAHDEHTHDISNDTGYWLDRCCDVLDVIDLNDYSAEQLADLAFVLESLCPPGRPLRRRGTACTPRPVLTLVID